MNIKYDIVEQCGLQPAQKIGFYSCQVLLFRKSELFTPARFPLRLVYCKSGFRNMIFSLEITLAVLFPL